jgi:hypothetical protein
MKKARAPFPQDGNNLWREVYPSGDHGLASVRRVRATLLKALLSMEDTLGAADRCPRRGGKRDAVLEAYRSAQAGREAAGFARAGPCWEMEA